MPQHRFRHLLQAEPAVPAAVTTSAINGFMVCPLVLQGAWSLQRHVYQMAYEQARAVVRPSLLDRWQTASAN